MKIQRNKSYCLFLMLLVSLTFVFGCGERNKSSILSGTVSHKQPIENNSTHEKETDIAPFNKVEYIEIILREGNILSIPYGWWFLSQVEEDTLVMECFNLSAISLFV